MIGRPVTLDDGTKARAFGRDGLYLPDDGTPERFPGAYQLKGEPRGFAWRIVGAELELREVWLDDGESTYPSMEHRESGRVVAHMVGDDYLTAFDRDELEPLGELDYCAVCGQVGCTHDGRDRSEEGGEG